MMRFVLHIGAHRTGSTSLQGLLSANKADLQDQGVGLWLQGRDRMAGARPTRPMLMVLDAVDAGRITRTDGAARIRHMMRTMVDEADDLTTVDTVILSEENLIGSMQQLVVDGTYLTAVNRLACLCDALKDDLSGVVLSIREPAAWFASAVRFVGQKSQMSDAAMTRQYTHLLTTGFCWSNLVDQLHAVAACPLTIIPLETSANPATRLSAMTNGATCVPQDLPHMNRGAGLTNIPNPDQQNAYWADLDRMQSMGHGVV